VFFFFFFKVLRSRRGLDFERHDIRKYSLLPENKENSEL